MAINFAKIYGVKSNAVRDMRKAVAAGEYKADELDVSVVPDGYQIGLTNPQPEPTPQGVKPLAAHFAAEARKFVEQLDAKDAADEVAIEDMTPEQYDAAIEASFRETPVSEPQPDLATARAGSDDPKLVPDWAKDAPEGVTVIGLDDMAAVHNTIAAAVGEPLLPTLEQFQSLLLPAPVSNGRPPEPAIKRIPEGMTAEKAAKKAAKEAVKQLRASATPKLDAAIKAGKAAAKAPKPAKAAAAKPEGLTPDQARLLIALVQCKALAEKPLAERVGVWVRSAAVHDSDKPHGLDMKRVPALMGSLKKAGLVECGWDKAATVRLTADGLGEAVGRGA